MVGIRYRLAHVWDPPREQFIDFQIAINVLARSSDAIAVEKMNR